MPNIFAGIKERFQQFGELVEQQQKTKASQVTAERLRQRLAEAQQPIQTTENIFKGLKERLEEPKPSILPKETGQVFKDETRSFIAGSVPAKLAAGVPLSRAFGQLETQVRRAEMRAPLIKELIRKGSSPERAKVQAAFKLPLTSKEEEQSIFSAIGFIQPTGAMGGKIPKKIPKGISKDLEPLAKEARKFKTAEEFVKAQEKNNPLLETAKDFENADDFISFYRGSSTQYGKYKPEIRKFGTTEESIRVPELGVDPEKKITIYRGIDTVQGGKMRGTINDGDFVTTDFDAANAYTGGKVVSKEVKAKDLILDYPEKSDFENPFYKGAEFIYSDSKNQIIKRSEADLRKIFDEAKSYQIKIPLTEWEKQGAYIQKNGKIPPNADLKGYLKSPEYNKYGTTERQRASAYYEYVSNKIDEAIKTKSQLIDIFNKAKGTNLAKEAQKYKTAEEFVRAQEVTGIDAGIRNDAKFGLLEDQRLSSSPDLKFILKENKIPTDAKKVTIFRASPGDFRSGDFAGLNRLTAERHIRTPSDKIFSKEVSIDDLIQGADQFEVIYSPKSQAKVLSRYKELATKEAQLKELGHDLTDMEQYSDVDVRYEDYSRQYDQLKAEIDKTKSQLIEEFNKAKGVKPLVKTETPPQVSPEASPQIQLRQIDKSIHSKVDVRISSKGSSLEEIVSSPDNIVNKVIVALKEARPLRGKQEALFSAERARRVAQVASVGKKVPGEVGFFRQLGQLKGELPKVEFEGIRPKLTQKDVDSLFDMIEGVNLPPLQKITAKTGLAKILQKEGGRIPTRNEMELLSEIFPPEFIKAITDKRPLSQKILQGLAESANVPMAIMATADMSAPLRQGLFFIGRPKRFWSAFGDSFKYFFSEGAYQGIIENIKARPTYNLMREARLALTDVSSPFLTQREEVFMSGFAEKIPGFGKVVRASNRAYTGFLNQMRADVFDDLVRKAKGLGIEIPKEDIAKYINSATGRGDLGVFNRAAVVLNSAFFSPRLMASRINLLNPVFYTQLDPFVRKEALKDLLALGSVATTILGLAKMGGADVEADPRSADFGKIKLGNTRIDILGGFQQYIRLSAQLVSGKIISSTTGREITLGEGYKPLTRKDIVLRFFESKQSPVFSFATALATGQTNLGQELNIPTEVINRFIPFVIQDMYDLYQEGELSDLVLGIPAPFGVGIQTYGKQELVEGENLIGEPTMEIRPVPGMGEKISEKLFGMPPLSKSKTFNVQVYLDQLEQLPRNEAADIFDKIAKSNPDLAKQLLTIIKEKRQGITVHDKDLKLKGVSSGDRAKAILKDLNKLKTKEEKAALWEDLVKKKVITPEVARQLNILLKR